MSRSRQSHAPRSRFSLCDVFMTVRASLAPVTFTGLIGWIGMIGVAGSGSLHAQATGDDCEPFVRGDNEIIKTPGIVDLNDAVSILAYMFLGVSPPDCIDSMDFNDNGIVDLDDYTSTVLFSFDQGPPPAAPYPNPGLDPTPGIDIGPPDERFKFSLGSGQGVPNNTGIHIPVHVSNSEPIAGFQMIIGYNRTSETCPDLLIQEIRTEEGTLLSQENTEYIIAEAFNAQGVAYIGALKDFATPFYFHDGSDATLPAGEDQLVATIVLAISPCAQTGFTPMGFIDGDPLPNNNVTPPIPLPSAYNHVSLFGGGVARPVFDDSGAGVTKRLGFIRGDVDMDRNLGIDDPIQFLMWFFRGHAKPPCEDSMDANNDSRLGLADAIFFLQYMFRGGPQPPEPFPQPGVDPSDDGSESLGCDIDEPD